MSKCPLLEVDWVKAACQTRNKLGLWVHLYVFTEGERYLENILEA